MRGVPLSGDVAGARARIAAIRADPNHPNHPNATVSDHARSKVAEEMQGLYAIAYPGTSDGRASHPVNPGPMRTPSQVAAWREIAEIRADESHYRNPMNPELSSPLRAAAVAYVAGLYAKAGPRE
jgi:hypothetical protein